METKKTHYKKEFNSPYLSASDIIEPTVLTVSVAKYEKDQTNRTKDEFKVLYFKETKLPSGEKVKPMILNVGNNEIIRKFSGGSKYVEDWMFGYHVTIFVDPNVRFGRDTVEGLRLMSEKPKGKSELLPGTPEWSNAVESYKKNKNTEIIEKHRIISAENKKKLMVSQTKHLYSTRDASFRGFRQA